MRLLVRVVDPARPEYNAKPYQEHCSQDKKSAACSSHAIAGTARAIAKPRKQIGKDLRFTSARKVPSASNVKSTKLVAGAGNMTRTRTAARCSS